MRIGIDIDDTITDSWECLIPYYSKLFGITEEEAYRNGPYYSCIKDMMTIDEYFDMIVPIYDTVIPQVHLKPKVKETIDKLYEKGNTVYFITARGKGHTSPYEVSKEFLDKHQIKYEDIIIDCTNKADKCQELNIDLFIDDSYRHCKATSEKGINVLMPLTYYNEKYKEFPHFDDWEAVYDYVEGRWNNGE